MKQSYIYRIFVALTLLFGTVSVTTAADRFYIDGVNFEPGETKTLAFNLDNDQIFYGFQADITIPEGLEILTNSNGKAAITLSSRCDGSYTTVSNLLVSGTLRLGAFSTSHTHIDGRSGALLYLKVKAAENFDGGVIALTNILFVGVNDRDVELPDFTIKLGTQHSDSFYIPDFKIAVNETKRICIELDNETQFTAFQTDVSLPDGLTIIANSFAVTDRANGHSVSAKSFSDGRTRITCFNADNTVFSGNTGVILEFDVIADHNVSETCNIELKNNIFSTATAKEYVLVNTTTQVTTEKALVQGIKLDFSSLGLIVGKTWQLSAEVLPTFASTKDLVWSSNNPEVATVTANGLVTATGIGEAVISATAVDGSGVRAECAVTVSGIPVVAISLDRASANLMATETVTLSAIVSPVNASDKSVTWSSNNTEIASVDEAGVVTAIAVGEAVISATSVSNPDISAACVVNVIPTLVSEIILSQTSVSLQAGQSFEFTAEVLPKIATNKSLVWTVDNSDIATVDENGKITALALGSTTVIASATDGGGVSARSTVNVVPTPVESIYINTPERTEFKVGETIALTATVLPEDASDKSVTWTGNDSNIAIVDDASGMVTAKNVGEVTITVTSSAGQTDEIILTVIPTLAENITVVPEKLTLRVNGTTQLRYTIVPSTTTNQSVSWSSSNPDNVSVDNEGNVTAMALGEATITASTTDGTNITSQCLVTVKPTPATGIAIQYDGPKELYVGQTAQLSAVVLPEDATDKSVNWTVQMAEVLNVDENGLVTAVGLGEAWVSVTNSAGQETLIIFKVIPTPVVTITLSQSSITIMDSESKQLSYTVSPADASDKTVVWSTSDSNIATVDNLGNITAISVGECDIIAAASDMSGVTANCHVTVIQTPATSIKIDQEGPIECSIGDVFQLTATVLPENATDKTVVWSSEAEDTATVDHNGVVTIKAIGELSITATNSVGQKDVIVIKILPTFAESIVLNRTTATMKVSGTLQLSAVFTPETTTNKSLNWSSSDASIASVDGNGLVMAHALGKCRITATAQDGSGITAYCDVTVGKTAAESIEISPREPFILNYGEQIQFTATVLPETTTDKSVSWMSQTACVVIDQNGLATAGAAVENNWIIATNSAGQTDRVYITVLPLKVSSIVLNSNDVQLHAGESYALSAAISPIEATDKSISWSSSDAGIVAVDANGNIKAVKVGEATITATANDGSGVSAICHVAVVPTPVENLVLSYSGAPTLKSGETLSITATIEPDDATDKTVTWTSSNESVAAVSNGVVIAQSVGEAVITAKAGDVSRTVNITVVPTLIESIMFSNTGVNLEVGQTHQMYAYIAPDSSTNKNLAWSSNNTSVMTVDGNGLITAVALGEAEVKATTTDGTNLSATCPIWVNPTVSQSVQIVYDGSTTLKVGDTAQLSALVLPGNATDKSVTWQVQNANILNVTPDGLLTAVGLGTAWVSVTDAVGNFAFLDFVVEPILIERIAIEPESARLKVGETIMPCISIYPENATNKEVTWDSNDKSCATVSADGLITAMAVGQTDICVRAADGSGAIQTIAIHIDPTPVESVDVYTNSNSTLKDGETVKLYANIAPTTATDQSLTWSSSDNRIATVSDEGLVTAHSVLGTVRITAKASNDVEGYMDVMVVATPAESIELNCNQQICNVGDYINVSAAVLPETATDKSVIWEVDSSGILRIQDCDNSVAVIEAVTPGEAYVYASLPDGTRRSISITVKPILVESIILNTTRAIINVGETLQLTASISPENATNKTVRWECPTDIVAIDENGFITAVKPGTADIVVWTTDGSGVMQTCFIEVVQPVTSIELSEHELTLTPQEVFTLIATIKPIDASDKSVSWSSSNENAATVDANGIISTMTEGETIITVQTLDGSNLSDECNLTVKKDDSCGITYVSIDDIDITITESQIIIQRLQNGICARLFNLNGVMIHSTVGNGESVYIDVVTDTIYVLKIGNMSLKIVVP